MTQALFSHELLAAAERLTMDVRPAPASPASGAHGSRAVGASLDFRDYRPYAPGDDLRRVDWNVYRRSGGHLFVRRFEHQTATPVHVLVDDSASMRVEAEAPRYAAAAGVAAALAAAALRTGDPLSIARSGPPGAILSGLTGRRQLPTVLAELARESPAHDVSLRAAVERWATSLPRRAGIAFIISDFFDEAGIEALAAQLDRVPHALVLVQVVQPWDAEPALNADVELVDCETNRSAVMSASRATIDAYRRAYADYQGALAGLASRRASGHVMIDASAPLVPQLAKLFPDGVLRIRGPAR